MTVRRLMSLVIVSSRIVIPAACAGGVLAVNGFVRCAFGARRRGVTTAAGQALPEWFSTGFQKIFSTR